MQENSTATHFEVLTRESVATLQNNALEKIRAFLGGSFPLSYARSLLEAYRWDEMIALAQYTENPERHNEQLGFAPANSGVAKSSAAEGCAICMDDELGEEEIVSLYCGHCVCVDCWKQYLTMNVREQKTKITCPGLNAQTKKKCTLIVEASTIAELLGDAEAIKRHADALLDSYVQQRGDLAWCANPKCDRIVRLTERATGGGGSDEVVCNSCLTAFCFGCAQQPHRPATCKMMEKWRAKSSGGDEDMSAQVIASMTRPCPHCKVAVEKNQGCNHMTCASCNFHYCWLCQGKFGSGPMGGTDGYQTHKCNGVVYKPDANTSKLQAQLATYNHFHDRFLTHHRSRELQKKAQADVVPRLVDDIMRVGGHSWRQAQFIAEAHDQDVINRTTIMNSYTFGYFRAVDMPFVNKEIFESLQGALERHTEILTHSYERKTTEELIRDEAIIRTATRSAENLRMALLDAATSWGEEAVLHSKNIGAGKSSGSALGGVKRFFGLTK